MHRTTFAAFIVLALTVPAFGGDYRAGRFGSFAYSHYPPATQFFYFVGQPVRIEALVEAEKRRDPEYRQFREFKKFREKLEADEADRAPNPAGRMDAAEYGTSNIRTLENRCSACHGGAAPEAELSLDGRRLTASQITAAQRRVLQGEMPPTGKLSPEEIGRVVEELLLLESSSEE